jgi:uncharacterized membrane protein
VSSGRVDSQQPSGSLASGGHSASSHLTLILAYTVSFAWRYRTRAHGEPVGAGLLALSAAGVAALGISGYLGGKLTYRYGVRVAAELTQADGYLTAGPELAAGHREQRGRHA